MGRYRRYLVLVIIIIAASSILIPLLLSQGKAWVQRYHTSGVTALSESVSSGLVYPIKPEQWLTFNILAGTKQLRIISNAHIRKPDNVALLDNWKYTLRYQLVDKNGRVISDKEYHQRSSLTVYKGESGEALFGNFYSGHIYTPLDGRLILLSMQEIQQATSIRLSFTQQNLEVEEVAVRLYIPSKISEHQLSATWLRMSDKQKKSLAKSNIYPPTLLTKTEISNLLKHQWQPVGPIGVEDKDYVSRTLYVYKEVELEKQKELMQASGLQFNQGHPAIIRIPEQGGTLDIKLRSLDGSPLMQVYNIQLGWFGRRRDQRWQREDQWLADTDKLSYFVEGGLLQIQSNSPVPVIVQAVLTTEGAEPLDITPVPPIVKGYLLSQGVDYQVLHVNDLPTTLRVDLRQFDEQTIESPDAKVIYQWFNAQQKLVGSGVLNVNKLPSIYDRLKGEYSELKLSDPVSYYLNIPSGVSRLRLVSEQLNVLVNAYNQPYQYRKKQRVPENAYISMDKEAWSPAWFVLNPENHAQLTKQQGVRKIVTQYRPPEDDPELLKDQYLWEDYRPQEQTEVRFILSAMTTLDYRAEALSSVYCQLPVNQIRHINLKALGNLPQLSPELIYIRDKKNIFDMSVYIDQQLLLNRPAMGYQGLFRLPYLDQGRHKVKLKTQAGGKWLMNNTQGCSTQAYLKRRVFKLKNRQLTFLYRNEQVEDRIFSGRFFTATHNKQRSIIDVNIEAMDQQPQNKQQDAWTFTQRRYDIRPAQDKSSIVLYSRGEYLNSGESFYVPFKHDLPKGLYKIKVVLKEGVSGYLSLSQLQPGVYEQRRFFRDLNLNP